MSETCLKLPNLDMSQLPIDKPSLSCLYEACKEWGFFYVTNHTISKDLLAEVCSISNQIFRLPLHSKLKLGPSSSFKTYTPHFIASPYFESLRVSGPDFFSSSMASADLLFAQQNSQEFSKVLEEFGNKMMELSKRIIKVILMSLGDNYDKKFNEQEFSNCHGYLRIVNYSPPRNVENKEVEGLGMHTDMSCITLLYQDENGGLQMRSKQGEWIDINPCEKNSLVVNIGDLMQAWSNGRLRSSEHRVMLKRPANRVSLAFFWCFEDEKVISAPEEVVGEGKLRVYKPFVCLDYLKFRENSEEGKFEKIGYTVNDFAGL
ncbi:gibberellin 20-oxidase-like protein [Euphorbia lathyris]|uniref:gibberellin 20-oxidase-like protein n=1 Tax=Euphorbia lathyris TaxID=212925 RepID=UPI003313B03E